MPTPDSDPAASGRAARGDLYLPNDAAGFLLTSAAETDGARQPLTERGSRAELMARGLALPIGLEEREPIVVRVVVGALHPNEEEEWVGRLRGRLALPDGRLALCAGDDALRGDLDLERARFVEVAPGSYRVTVLSQLVGVNGEACLARAAAAARAGAEDAGAGAEEADEAPGAYFRRTRPDVPFPAWLAIQLANLPHRDPGHEEEWEDFAESEEYAALEDPDLQAGLAFVDFVVHLEPAAAPTGEAEGGAAELGGDGWLREAEVRKPARYPLGLEAEDLWGE